MFPPGLPGAPSGGSPSAAIPGGEAGCILNFRVVWAVRAGSSSLETLFKRGPTAAGSAMVSLDAARGPVRAGRACRAGCRVSTEVVFVRRERGAREIRRVLGSGFVDLVVDRVVRRGALEGLERVRGAWSVKGG